MKQFTLFLCLLCLLSPAAGAQSGTDPSADPAPAGNPGAAPDEHSDDGPLLAGLGGVDNPQLLPEFKIAPEYPELARLARLTGNVILQAVIGKDGTVSDLEVLRCNRPDVGFEEAAIEAVRQWRYKPATKDGEPVDVYFTIFVDFKLDGVESDEPYVNEEMNYRVDPPGDRWVRASLDEAPPGTDVYYQHLDPEAIFIVRSALTGMGRGEMPQKILSNFILYHFEDASEGYDVLDEQVRVINGMRGVRIVVGMPAGGPDLIQVNWAYAKNGVGYLLVFVTDGAGIDIDTIVEMAEEGFGTFSLIDPDRAPPENPTEAE